MFFMNKENEEKKMNGTSSIRDKEKKMRDKNQLKTENSKQMMICVFRAHMWKNR